MQTDKNKQQMRQPYQKKEAHSSMDHNEVCVPASSLQMPGQDEMMMNPEIGDPVTMTIEGKVSRIEEGSGNAYVTMDTVNGHAVNSEAEKTTDSQGEEFSQLRDMAKEMDGGAMTGSGGY